MTTSDTRSLRSQLARLRARRPWPVLLVLLGCALVLSVLGFGRLHSQFGIEAMHSAEHYKEQLDRFDRLLVLMLDAETGVRGYLLNDRRPAYLEPYTASERTIDPLLARIAEDYPPDSADHAEFAQLAQLIAMKRRLLAEYLTGGEFISPVRTGQMGRGKLYMDQIRMSIGSLREHIEARNRQMIEESIARFGDIQHTITMLALGAIGLVLALFAVQQRQASLRARIAELLERENQALESTVAERTQELSDLASYLTDTREAEQARLARELHDELGALLTAARMDAAWLLRTVGPDAPAAVETRFRRLIDTLGSGIAIKRRIIDDLRPPLLQGLGLVEALRALLDDLRGEYQLRVHLPDHDVACAEEQSLALFRIAQEAVTNIRKYARAGTIELGLAVDGGEVRLWITDDGVGFDPANPQLSRHGIAGMKHRVQMFEGRFSLVSAPGAGTRVEARMPMRPDVAALLDDEPVA